MTQSLNAEEEEEAALAQVMRSAKRNISHKTKSQKSSCYAAVAHIMTLPGKKQKQITTEDYKVR